MYRIVLVVCMGMLIGLTGCSWVSIDTSSEPMSGQTHSGRLSQTHEVVMTKLTDTGLSSTILFDLDLFNTLYKKALFETGKEKLDTVQKSMKDALAWWNALVQTHTGKTLTVFSATQDPWQVLLSIDEHMQQAQTFVDQKNYSEAHEELEQVRKILFTLRQENDIKNISDDFLLFHDVMEKVVETAEKDMVQLQKLSKYGKILWSYYPDNEQYQTFVATLNDIVTALIAQEGEKYQQTLTKLKPAFIKAYLAFG